MSPSLYTVNLITSSIPGNYSHKFGEVERAAAANSVGMRVMSRVTVIVSVLYICMNMSNITPHTAVNRLITGQQIGNH